jgi:hypothetical protein
MPGNAVLSQAADQDIVVTVQSNTETVNAVGTLHGLVDLAREGLLSPFCTAFKPSKDGDLRP